MKNLLCVCAVVFFANVSNGQNLDKAIEINATVLQLIDEMQQTDDYTRSLFPFLAEKYGNWDYLSQCKIDYFLARNNYTNALYDLAAAAFANVNMESNAYDSFVAWMWTIVLEKEIEFYWQADNLYNLWLW